jgi:hypothetical protein
MRFWRRWLGLFVFFISFSSVVFGAEDIGRLVVSITTLHKKADAAWPRHLVEGKAKNGTELNVSEYFKYFKHISPPKGQILDYVFCGSANGRPFLYWRDETAASVKSCGDFKDIYSGTDLNMLANQLTLDGDNDAFYEFLIFNILADKFYLSWHSGYNEIWIVTSKEAVEDIIKEVNTDQFGSNFDDSQMKAARALDVNPAMDVTNKDSVTVSVVTFSKWGGFNRVTKKVSRSYPHIVLEEKQDNLLEYNCQVMF